VGSALIILASGSSLAPLVAIALGGLAGLWLLRSASRQPLGAVEIPVSRAVGTLALVLFVALLAGLPLLQHLTGSSTVALLDAFYRSGALVFGGGHVVLPLLHDAVVVPGWVSDDAFLAGYGAAQAVPGPLFTFAAYLGAVASVPPQGVAGAVLGLVGIFLPGMLILVGALPFWDALRQRVRVRALMAGVNAAVVGLLAAALYDPVWTSAVKTPVDFAIALVGFVLLIAWRVPPWLVVIVCALSGMAEAALG
jgi:chromate transporter